MTGQAAPPVRKPRERNAVLKLSSSVHPPDPSPRDGATCMSYSVKPLLEHPQIHPSVCPPDDCKFSEADKKTQSPHPPVPAPPLLNWRVSLSSVSSVCHCVLEVGKKIRSGVRVRDTVAEELCPGALTHNAVPIYVTRSWASSLNLRP